MQLNEQQTKWAKETLERVSHKLEKVSERSKSPTLPWTGFTMTGPAGKKSAGGLTASGEA